MTCEAMVGWGTPGVCDGCAEPLTGRSKRWCKGNCGQLYWENHRWNVAREKALSRSAVFEFKLALQPFVKRRVSRVARKIEAPAKRFYRTGWRCMRCGTTTHAPEVNHIVPAMGKHAVESCAHHQENLEVLCRDCHLATTKRQREAGLFKR